MDMTQIEKMNKNQLIPYIKELIDKFNQQVNNYNVLYSEYQKLLETKNSESVSTENLDEDKILLQKELDSAKLKIEELTNSIAILEQQKTEIQVEPKAEPDNSQFLKEIDELKNEIMILKSQNVSSKKLPDINSLEKCKNGTYIVQTYNISAFENRVDNSEIYGGRKFTIATILIKLENLVITWSYDFKGSELFEPKKEMRKLIITEQQLEAILTMGKNQGMYNALKFTFDIKDNFSPETFFNSPVFIAGEKLDAIQEDIK